MAQRKKVLPQKRRRQKQKRKAKQQRKKPRKNMAIRSVRNYGRLPNANQPKILPPVFPSQGKTPLSMKGKRKAVFAQRYLITTQNGGRQQQQCFFSNYMEDTVGTNEAYPAIMGPPRTPMVRWSVTMAQPQQRALASNFCHDGQPRLVFTNAAPSSGMCSKMDSNSCTPHTQHEVNEVSRQLIPWLFPSDPNTLRY